MKISKFGLWQIHPEYTKQVEQILDQSLQLNQQKSMQSVNDSFIDIQSNNIAIVNIDGILIHGFGWHFPGGVMDTRLLCEQIQKLENNSEVSGVLLNISSPGGTVTGSWELGELIRDFKKPIVAFTDNLIASAGYEIACGADKIIATKTSTIGSIGTILVHTEYSKRLEEAGITVTPIKAGKYKQAEADYKPLSDDDKDYLQKRIDDDNNAFLNFVAENRNLSLEEKDKWAEARVFRGFQAIEVGLIDKIGNKETAIEELNKLINELPKDENQANLQSFYTNDINSKQNKDMPEQSNQSEVSKDALRIKELEKQVADLEAEKQQAEADAKQAIVSNIDKITALTDTEKKAFASLDLDTLKSIEKEKQEATSNNETEPAKEEIEEQSSKVDNTAKPQMVVVGSTFNKDNEATEEYDPELGQQLEDLD